MITKKQANELWKQYREYSAAIRDTMLQVEYQQYSSQAELDNLLREIDDYRAGREQVYNRIQREVVI